MLQKSETVWRFLVSISGAVIRTINGLTLTSVHLSSIFICQCAAGGMVWWRQMFGPVT